MKAFVLFALGLAVLLMPAASKSADSDGLSGDPAHVKIVTSDITNFWRAYDAAQKDGDLAGALERDYLAPGTPGLRGFITNRIVSAKHLAGEVAKYRDYYVATRPYMNRIADERPLIVADLNRYKALYPKAVFPDVYFVVGGLNSGGTSVDDVGLVIGAEMVSRPPGAKLSMPGFESDVLSTADTVPGLVSHEFTHYNQHDADPSTLLGATIYEGTADFMADMVDPIKASKEQWSFGCAHEDALWGQFQQQMNSPDEHVIKPWLFSFDRGPLEAPPFIGYWLGSRIVQTYYVTHGSSASAIDDALHIKNFQAFLAASGYPAKRPACIPIAPA